MGQFLKFKSAKECGYKRRKLSNDICNLHTLKKYTEKKKWNDVNYFLLLSSISLLWSHDCLTPVHQYWVKFECHLLVLCASWWWLFKTVWFRCRDHIRVHPWTSSLCDIFIPPFLNSNSDQFCRWLYSLNNLSKGPNKNTLNLKFSHGH